MKKVFLCKETADGETRVAIVPADIKALIGIGCEIAVQSGAGLKATISLLAKEFSGE